MTQQGKQLLLRDLCARLLYGVKCQIGELTPLKLEAIDISDTDGLIFNFGKNSSGYRYDFYLSEVKPYLRPMSSMTDEEAQEYYDLCYQENDDIWGKCLFSDITDFCNQHHLDYRGLIEKGLALEAPEGMYK